jgi:hypothetical protein
MKAVYLCHPIGGDVENNVRKIKRIFLDLWKGGGEVFPIAPYITPLESGEEDDNVFEQRMRGLVLDCQYVKFADEVWLYGDRISAGMWQEISVALALNIPVKAMTEGTQKDLNKVLA